MVSSHTSPTRALNGQANRDDHAISLIDATGPASPDIVSPATTSASAGIERTSSTAGLLSNRTSGEQTPTRLWQKGGIRDEMTRRKYARFQEHHYNGNAEEQDKDAKALSRSETVMKHIDERRGRVLQRLHLRPKKAAKVRNLETAVDILYENQRGLFFFGYPLYSSRSLLNFDPGPWTNAEFEDSPVDIRNAQVPDPTWVWTWKRWYVDMSGDVDEQGWQYSLTFGKKFSWHGTHPLLHSAVRRRRWLRKRSKVDHILHEGDGHDLSQDYFTIHSARRDTSRGSSAGRETNKNSSRYSGRFETPESESEDEITNVVSLLQEMKKTTVDRKKLDAFKSFVENGGDELHFLPDVIPEVLSLFIYQNARRQLMSILDSVLHKLENQSKDSESQDKYVGYLQASMQIVRDNLHSIEYYSDKKAIRKEIDDHNQDHSEETNIEQKQAGKQLAELEPSNEPARDINVEVSRVQIKGIPKSAGVDVELGIARP
jgi:hypothetical protein